MGKDLVEDLSKGDIGLVSPRFGQGDGVGIHPGSRVKDPGFGSLQAPATFRFGIIHGMGFRIEGGRRPRDVESRELRS
jgi:hypothetical protein